MKAGSVIETLPSIPRQGPAPPRFLTQDDAAQSPIARRVVLEGDIFIPITVTLETEWVLRDGYDYSAKEVADALAELAGSRGVTVESPAEVAAAIKASRIGMDFADALQLAKSDACDVFFSFDKTLAKLAKGKFTNLVRVPEVTSRSRMGHFTQRAIGTLAGYGRAELSPSEVIPREERNT